MLLLLHAEWYCNSTLCSGWFSQLVFMAHDISHMDVTYSLTNGSVIGMIIAVPIGDLSSGWWKCTHNIYILYCDKCART